MTTQDLYFGIQTGLQLLIGGGVVWAMVWFGGMVKRALEVQSTVVQDVERNSKIMQQVIDLFNPEAQLRREQARQELHDYRIKALEDDMAKMRQEVGVVKLTSPFPDPPSCGILGA